MNDTPPKDRDWQERLSVSDKELVRQLREACDIFAKSDICFISTHLEGSENGGVFKDIYVGNAQGMRVPFPSSELGQLVTDVMGIRFYPSWMRAGTVSQVAINVKSRRLDVLHRYLRGKGWGKFLDL